MMKDGLISIAEAASAGIERIRSPIWTHPFDHFKIDIAQGLPGPWLHLHAPSNREWIGRDPVDIFWSVGINDMLKIDMQASQFAVYRGPMPDSAEYKAAVEAFSQKLSSEVDFDQVEQP
jgi:hypothetical protein